MHSHPLTIGSPEAATVYALMAGDPSIVMPQPPGTMLSACRIIHHLLAAHPEGRVVVLAGDGPGDVVDAHRRMRDGFASLGWPKVLYTLVDHSGPHSQPHEPGSVRVTICDASFNLSKGRLADLLVVTPEARGWVTSARRDRQLLFTFEPSPETALDVLLAGGPA